MPLCNSCHDNAHALNRSRSDDHAKLTKEGLDRAKAAGVNLGRPTTLSRATRQRIVSLRNEGFSYSKIAFLLNEDRTPTAHGGSWWASTIRKVLR